MKSGPVLVGTEGVVRGERFELWRGASVVVGRSRSCDISLRRCKAWLAMDEEKRRSDRDFKTVSRKHVRITYREPGKIEIEDLSSNGTFLDGRRIERVEVTDLRERPHELLLGTREKFLLEWQPLDEEHQEESP